MHSFYGRGGMGTGAGAGGGGTRFPGGAGSGCGALPPSRLGVPFSRVGAVAPARVGNGSSFLIRISWSYDQNNVVFTLPLFRKSLRP